MPRRATHRYVDPLDAIWIAAAGRIGFRVERSPDVYASTDGAGVLSLGTPDTLDPDDCVAQMVLHELCHSLVEGRYALRRVDWGLDNTSPRDLPREHACLRLQAALTDPWGLRWVLAPTTEHRAFYDALPRDPLSPPGHPTTVMARRGLARADGAPWAPHLHRALEATARIVDSVADVAGPDDAGERPPLHALAEPARDRNPAGFPLEAPDRGHRCGGCAWRYRGGRGRPVDRCRQAAGARIHISWPACERFEAELDCRACAGCCREAYDAVMVSRRDPFVRAHPELVLADGKSLLVRREGGRCAALVGGRAPGEPFACRVYHDRPRPCREFERGGDHCLMARRAVGLSR